VKSELRALMGTLKEDSAKEMGQKLKERIEEFERKNDIEEY
jgi:PHD/YefM family antitoxin component YafN of YafNO toxin-antitoxin module